MAYVPRRLRRTSRLGFRLSPALKNNLLLYGAGAFFLLIIVGFLGAFGLFAWYGRDLPQPGKLSESRGSSTVFYDRNDEVLYEMFKDENRVPVRADDIAETLFQATVAIEDKRFYEHKGISEWGILRAAIQSALGNPQGGSTITQQLIKNVLLTSERRLSRKIKEAILAYEVEKRYSKREILEMYLNEAPYGGTYVGVGSASMGYFGKTPKELNLLESAFLAGLPQNPSVYSPFIGKKDSWKGRTKDVLRRMREDEYITKDQEKKALEQLERMKFSSPKVSITAPHFVFYLRRELEKEYGSGLFTNGAKIKTTIDLKAQRALEKIVRDEVEGLEKFDVGNGALIAIDPQSGDILAYVGSYDYNNDSYGKFDVVSQGNRQPGSTLKPIEYALALEKGYTAATVLMDVKTEFPGESADKPYVPVNYDGKYRGPVQIRFALGNSYNVPAVKMLAMLGMRDFMQLMFDMGLRSMEPTSANMRKLGLSVSLGGGESTLLDVTRAYGVFANGGRAIETSGVLDITDFNGKRIAKREGKPGKQILSQDIAFIISHILSDNNARADAFGTNSFLVIPGKTVAVKTGTTDDKRDNWAIGYTREVALGVWVGNNDNSKMNPNVSSGATGASPIFNKAMRELLKTYKDGIPEKPDSVEALEIDSFLGGLPHENFGKRTEYFIKGTEPKDVSPFYKKVRISKANGKLANDVEVRSGNYEEKDFFVITEKDPVSTDGKNRWQEGIDAWAREQSDPKWQYPTETSDASSEEVVVQIRKPGNESRIDTNDVEIEIRITSLSPIKEIKIKANDGEKKLITEDKKEFTEKITLENGKYELKVEAKNEKNKSGSATVKIGVNEDWK